MRSSWKIKPIISHFIKNAFLNKSFANGEIVKVWSKGAIISSNLLEKRLEVYNGLKFVEFVPQKEMSGESIGSFILTKRITSDIHSKTHKNKKGRRKKKK